MLCRIYGSESGFSVFVATEKMYGIADAHPYFQCGACRCLQISHIPG
jgi:hypothetical protein